MLRNLIPAIGLWYLSAWFTYIALTNTHYGKIYLVSLAWLAGFEFIVGLLFAFRAIPQALCRQSK